MSPTAVPVGTRPLRNRRYPFEWWWVAIAVLAVALLLAVMPLLRTGSFVDHVSVTNRSPYDIDVAVAPASSDGWMPLGTAANRDTLVIDDVYDQGSVWVFRFSALDRQFDLRMTREDLVRANWKVGVPAQLVSEMRGTGASPSPRTPSE